ncbi:hypothetical protein [Sphingomonas sp.]|uniref:hypothetical protein n=1 Tax=Sphingomonas sp. TaxID=28214 RepID=UPI002ED809B1
MESNQQSLTLSSMGLDWVTTTHLVFIVLFAIGAVAILIWGRHLRRKRQQADARIEENNEAVDDDAPSPPPTP